MARIDFDKLREIDAQGQRSLAGGDFLIGIWAISAFYGTFLGLYWMLGYYDVDEPKNEQLPYFHKAYDPDRSSRPIRPYEKVIVYSAILFWIWAIFSVLT